jgi:hypothetical protein
MKSTSTSCPDHPGEVKQVQLHARVVQQLMFNRILTFVRLLSIDGVTVAGFDAKSGALACSLAGVNLVVEVTLAGGS